MSSKANDAARRAGFTLVEVLVALVVAGLFLGVLGRAFADAWGATRTPQETVSAMMIARAVAQGDASGAFPQAGKINGYSFRRSTDPVEIETRPSSLAPAPAADSAAVASAPGMPVPVDTMPGVSDVGPANAGSAAVPGPRQLRRIAIVVTAPSGRRASLETIRLDPPSN